MRRFLALFLCFCVTVPLLVSCGDTGTSSEKETNESLSETAHSEPGEWSTDPFEGESVPDDLSIPDVIHNTDGSVLGSIVLPKDSDATLRIAAEELQYHIKKVTGAEMPIVSRTGEGYGSLILATPESLPQISERFPEDLAWLADLGSKETGKWASDGFAIRQSGDDMYIIGNKSRGVLNGAYDWIEENLGVLWIRADEDKGLIFQPLETVTIQKTDYREKSPFEYRSCVPCRGNRNYSDPDLSFERMISRNKLNGVSGWYAGQQLKEYGFYRICVGHNVKQCILYSPLYDPDETEYWCTDQSGNRLTAETSPQINWWSEKAVEAVAAYVVSAVKSMNLPLFFIGIEDVDIGKEYYLPESGEPFEYAPGQWIEPQEKNYLSTVVFSFVNRVAELTKDEIPDIPIAAFAYNFTIRPAACEIDDRVMVVFAPAREDMSIPLCSDAIKQKKGLGGNEKDYCDWIRAWSEKTDNLVIYNYYGCGYTADYERPIWDRMQQDFQDYIQLGIVGLSPEGIVDDGLPTGPSGEVNDEYTDRVWGMNTLTYWLYSKLAWNPFEDVQSLIREFCDKVYGAASEAMQDYYRLLKEGFEKGITHEYYKTHVIFHSTTTKEYYSRLVRWPGVEEEMISALNTAFEVADDASKVRIGFIRDIVLASLEAIP